MELHAERERDILENIGQTIEIVDRCFRCLSSLWANLDGKMTTLSLCEHCNYKTALLICARNFLFNRVNYLEMLTSVLLSAGRFECLVMHSKWFQVIQELEPKSIFISCIMGPIWWHYSVPRMIMYMNRSVQLHQLYQVH